MHKHLNPGWAWAERAGVMPGVLAGNLILTCGVVALTSDGTVVGKGDAYTQTQRIFANIGEVLAEAGAGLHDIVKLTIFIRSIEDYPAVKAARAEAFPGGYKGVSTLVVAEMFDPDVLVEIEAMALAPEG